MLHRYALWFPHGASPVRPLPPEHTADRSAFQSGRTSTCMVRAVRLRHSGSRPCRIDASDVVVPLARWPRHLEAGGPAELGVLAAGERSVCVKLSCMSLQHKTTISFFHCQELSGVRRRAQL